MGKVRIALVKEALLSLVKAVYYVIRLDWKYDSKRGAYWPSGRKVAPDLLQDAARASARDLCSIVGPELMAEELGVEWTGTNRAEVAAAYAQAYRMEVRLDAYQGALAGFADHAVEG